MAVDSVPAPRIAFFISPHGFGHAARAAAVMDALARLLPGINLHVFTTVPAWFFAESVPVAINYHPTATDIGLAQDSALRENIPETCDRLDAFLPFSEREVNRAAAEVLRRGCSLVACDIAPFGIAVAKAAGVTSVLIENFIWDWIYEEYLADDPRLAGHVAYLRGVYAAADHVVQTRPAHARTGVGRVTPPVARRSRLDRVEVRRRLGLAEDATAVLLTMGGARHQYTFLAGLAALPQVHFLIPGVPEDTLGGVKAPPNVRLFPAASGFFHPDLITACDAVIGKAGYSTLAEVYWAGVPFGYVLRSRFRESALLEAFIQEEMSGLRLEQVEFETGGWLARLPQVLDLPRRQPRGPDGALVVAEYLLGLVDEAPASR